jgi:hypothetical protein
LRDGQPSGTHPSANSGLGVQLPITWNTCLHQMVSRTGPICAPMYLRIQTHCYALYAAIMSLLDHPLLLAILAKLRSDPHARVALAGSGVLTALLLLLRLRRLNKVPRYISDPSKVGNVIGDQIRQYDVIIVGGGAPLFNCALNIKTNAYFRAGTSGCVLASRLSEDPSVRVLLLEAGQRSFHSHSNTACRTNKFRPFAVVRLSLTAGHHHFLQGCISRNMFTTSERSPSHTPTTKYISGPEVMPLSFI